MSQLIKDPLFGEMEAQRESVSGVWNLYMNFEKTAGDYDIVLCIESADMKTSELHLVWYRKIMNDLPKLIESAVSVICNHYKEEFHPAGFLKKYAPDSVLMPLSFRADHLFWEMEFLKFENDYASIIVTFDGITPGEIYRYDGN